MEKYIIENGITYELRSEQYYPVFKEPEQYQIGKYGLLHLEYIKAHRKLFYSTLLMEGKLNGYLHGIDNQAKDLFQMITNELAEKDGITEKLKVIDQMEWVRRMNNIRQRATEFVNDNIVWSI